ncbi:MAG: hypothetical protein WCG87_08075 [Bacteroidota bacterium]
MELLLTKIAGDIYIGITLDFPHFFIEKTKKVYPLLGCVLFLLSNLFFLLGCSKKHDTLLAVICNNPDALNYQKNGNCTFPKDSIVGKYMVIVTNYAVPCSANINGENFGLTVDKDICIGFASDSSYKVLHFTWLGSTFTNENFCVNLTDGYNFIITAADNVTWALAPITGNGSFVNGKFTFTGIVQSGCGNWPLILDGQRQQ